MNKQEFRVEAHKYLDDLLVDFEGYQNETASLLDVFINFCNENNIKYFVAFGSLLGLVRDHGPIPWDYDTDVCVPITEVSKILAAQDKLPSGYYFESNYTNDNTQFYQMRLFKEGADKEFVHLDVFYIIGAPSSKEEVEKLSKQVHNVFSYRFYWYTQKQTKCSLLRRVYNNIKLRRMYGHHSIKKNNRLFSVLSTKYDYEKSDMIMTFSVTAAYLEKNVIEPLQTLEVNGKKYLVPNNIDKYLKRYYKDYHSYLSISNRFNEFYQIIYEYNLKRGKNAKELYSTFGES